eukprot:7155287-Prymnesium_polylepis.1
MRDGKCSVIPKAVVRPIVSQVVAPARKRGASVVVVILCPQVRAVVVHLQAARAFFAADGRQRLPPCKVSLILRRPLGLSVGCEGEEALQHTQPQRIVGGEDSVALPKPRGREGI